MRRVIPVLAVVLLVAAVWFFWPDATDSPTTTTPETSGSTTTTTTSAGPTTTDASPTTTDTSHVVETVEEAEAILQELWFGWFEGIYNQDEERIREVVVLEETVETAKESFGVMTFSRAPSLELVSLGESDLLRSESECIAIWSRLDVSRFRQGAEGSSGVYVLRFHDSAWRLLSVWPLIDDLWEGDCAASLS